MTEHPITVEPMKVHLTGSDLPLTAPRPKRCRYGVTLRTFILTSDDPVQLILPQNDRRREAYIQNVSSTDNFSIHRSLADAQADGTGGVTVPGANTAPYPLHTHDAIWATAATDDLPLSISVSAIIETDEP